MKAAVVGKEMNEQEAADLLESTPIRERFTIGMTVVSVLADGANDAMVLIQDCMGGFLLLQ